MMQQQCRLGSFNSRLLVQQKSQQHGSTTVLRQGVIQSDGNKSTCSSAVSKSSFFDVDSKNNNSQVNEHINKKGNLCLDGMLPRMSHTLSPFVPPSDLKYELVQFKGYLKNMAKLTNK